MKLLTASFQQSQAITSTRAEEIIEHIKEGSSLRRQYWHDYGGVLLFCFGIVILAFMSAFAFPHTFGAVANVFYLLAVAQAVIAAPIMLISSFYHNWIVEQLVFQSLMSIVVMAIIFIILPFFYLATKKITGPIEFILLELFCVVVTVFGIYLTVKSIIKQRAALLQIPNPSQSPVFTKIDKGFKVISAYSSIILLLILVFKWLQKLFFRSFEWDRTLKAIGFTLFLSLFPAGLIYFIVAYSPMNIFLPLYYLKKYQSEYEAKYQISFKG
ncbi:hypothetical protein GYT97_03540 [Lactobacillus mellis]|uniref:hypothetical protein n=1 Tax=Bombilactobacillus mellis TaxID=1218508 RepID=UPI0015803197|nr:hypothetical protein [Bombilactobacillus mellis]NUG38952.1 hypothetical protein [Bombilactobacillus mellis]